MQRKVFELVQPEPLKAAAHWGPSTYPPFVAMFFQPFAMLPYWTAFRLWLAISLALYLSGLWLLIRRFCSGDLLERSIFLLFGLSFWPFISWILAAGQLSAIGFLAMALAIYWEDSDRHFWSGLALSICSYKPTLLLLILPMLLVIRRFKTLAGFSAGAFTLAAAAAVAGGPGIWAAYIKASAGFSSMVTHVLPVTLDLRGFCAAIPHAGRFTRALLVCAGGLAGGCMAVAWWRARHYVQHGPATPIWATTLTWTLLLNVYVPVYDSVLVVVSVIATAATLIRFAPRIFVALCLVLLVSSYLSTWLASQIGWQILTPVLAAVAILQLAATWPARTVS